MDDLKDKLLEIVNGEFDGFKEDMLGKTKEEIFSDYHIINFYNEVRGFFNDCELADEQYEALIKDGADGLLENLWGYYLKSDYASVGSYSDTEDLISGYVDDLAEINELENGTEM